MSDGLWIREEQLALRQAFEQPESSRLAALRSAADRHPHYRPIVEYLVRELAARKPATAAADARAYVARWCEQKRASPTVLARDVLRFAMPELIARPTIGEAAVQEPTEAVLAGPTPQFFEGYEIGYLIESSKSQFLYAATYTDESGSEEWHFARWLPHIDGDAARVRLESHREMPAPILSQRTTKRVRGGEQVAFYAARPAEPLSKLMQLEESVFPRRARAQVLKAVATAVRQIHTMSSSTFHGDLRPELILVDNFRGEAGVQFLPGWAQAEEGTRIVSEEHEVWFEGCDVANGRSLDLFSIAKIARQLLCLTKEQNAQPLESRTAKQHGG